MWCVRTGFQNCGWSNDLFRAQGQLGMHHKFHVFLHRVSTCIIVFRILVPWLSVGDGSILSDLLVRLMLLPIANGLTVVAPI